MWSEPHEEARCSYEIVRFLFLFLLLVSSKVHDAECEV
jgi:hypothetical protein